MHFTSEKSSFAPHIGQYGGHCMSSDIRSIYLNTRIEMRKYVFELMLVIVLLLATLSYIQNRIPFKERFGMSPGTMDQLQSTHVTTQEDVNFYRNVYPKMVRREITDLTEEDPGELRPWVFPWYSRNLVLMG